MLHAIYGLNTVMGGNILVGEGAQAQDVAHMTANQKLKQAGIAYILQDKSIFPDMTVEENLWMGGFLMETTAQAKEAAEKVFAKYDRLAQRRKHLAKVLSGGGAPVAGNLPRPGHGPGRSAGG